MRRNQLALPRGLDDYLAERERVVAHLCQADEQRKAAAQVINESFRRYGLPSHCEPRLALERQIEEVDRLFWHYAFDATGLRSVMDATAKEEFDNQMRRDRTPAFTEETVRATMQGMALDAETMWRRGVVRVFQRLSGQYARHEAFRVAPKIIMQHMTTPRMDRGRQIGFGRPADIINDIDRVLSLLQGKRHVERDLEARINAALYEGEPYADERIRVTGYKNGNLHMEFRDQSLLDGINRIIAEHYGETIGHDNGAKK